MLGAIVGDIVGSPYEFHNIKRTDFPFLTKYNRFTDDSVMTLANAKWLTEDPSHSPEHLVKCMRELGRAAQGVSYGPSFLRWLYLPDEFALPYNSWGNGAQAIATCVFLARTSKDVFSEDTKSSIKEYVEKTFGYNLDFTLNEIRPSYTFDVSCQGSCPHAIRAYLEGKDFEDAVRLAVSIGGDSDTIACMTGAIAGAKGNIPEAFAKTAYQILKPSLRAVLDEFEKTLSEHSL